MLFRSRPRLPPAAGPLHGRPSAVSSREASYPFLVFRRQTAAFSFIIAARQTDDKGLFGADGGGWSSVFPAGCDWGRRGYKQKSPSHSPEWEGLYKCLVRLRTDVQGQNHSMILPTTPEPTVRPPSRIAKRRPSSIATGVSSSTCIMTLSPGMHISVPSGRVMMPVTSVVRK